MQKPAEKVVHLPRRAKHARHPRWQAAVAGLDDRVARLERRLARFDRHYRRLAVPKRMRNAAFVSVILHVFFIFGVTFTMPDAAKLDAKESLEVVLVNAQSKSAPLNADALAQHNLDGGGNTDEKRVAQSPLPVLPDQTSVPEVHLALKKVQHLEREAKQLIAQTQVPSSPIDVAPAPSKTPPEAQAEGIVAPDATELMRKSFEIARLEAKISRDWDGYQQRPRRLFVGARTKEVRYARYIEDWRTKVQRIGELNYPQAARDQRVFGSLVVTVGIRADGSVESIDITRPSGFKVLDEAARRIVQLAAPYGPLPADITKDIDVLHITRTWTFTPADRFVSAD
jgi:protein TonB